MRVYAAFYDPNEDVSTWSQTRKKQINLLANLSEHYPMRNGYVCWQGAQLPKFPKRGTKAYDDMLKKTYIGYHKDIQVTTGHRTPSYIEVVNSNDQFIDQVLCAAVNLGEGTDSGKYNRSLPDCQERCRFVLDHSYESAYAGAIAQGRKHLVLTLIGGGAFGNDREMIYSALLDAHLNWTQHSKCTLEKVSIVLFRADELVDKFLNSLVEHKVPYLYEWYKGDGSVEIKSKYVG